MLDSPTGRLPSFPDSWFPFSWSPVLLGPSPLATCSLGFYLALIWAPEHSGWCSWLASAWFPPWDVWKMSTVWKKLHFLLIVPVNRGENKHAFFYLTEVLISTQLYFQHQLVLCDLGSHGSLTQVTLVVKTTVKNHSSSCCVQSWIYPCC